MKRFLWTLGAGFVAGAVAEAWAAKNHEKMMQLVKNLPSSLTLSPNASLEELTVHKERLEELIRQKEEELARLKEAEAKA